jgi:REP element-mobilizing transposase RayT
MQQTAVDQAQLRRRRTSRYPGYDYASSGAYFVTVVAQDRTCLFGAVTGDVMHPNDAGCAVLRCWQELPGRFPSVNLDEFVVMPNHVHGIIWLTEISALHDQGAASSAPTLGRVMRAFKSMSAIEVNRLMGRRGRLWQRGYYERVVRSDGELRDVRNYILQNPARWPTDVEYSER